MKCMTRKKMTPTGKQITEAITRENLLTSILTIDQLQVRPVSIDKVLIPTLYFGYVLY